ncbi:MAG: hypothetical protein JNK82_27890 [Myxococcaceae bacterium]|nr:hypothetical protein [Myxococcaceae bacterium]
MSRLLAFAPVHALHQTAQLFVRPDALTPWLVPLHLGCAALAVKRPRLAMGLTAVLGAAQCAAAFPRTATHLWLGVVVSVLFALVGDDEEELPRVALALPLIVLGWSGVQKLVNGHWFHGELLAWLAVSRPDVTLTVLPFIGEGELQGLQRVDGSGPFRLGGGWAVLSNAVWVVELCVPLAAIPSALRPRLWWLLLGLLWSLQLVAHEWQFALLMSNVLLCCAPAAVQPRWRATIVAVLLGLVVARLLGVHVPAELVT